MFEASCLNDVVMERSMLHESITFAPGNAVFVHVQPPRMIVGTTRIFVEVVVLPSFLEKKNTGPKQCLFFVVAVSIFEDF